ncbi:hypothetical protein [Burkholderia sp. L27(2015)]|uniref:hypothetical protein n=1 Tax=Burkholderia sp. L27(2015) TaxID=1641858 RepID=UPI00131D5BBD|nr:hypothetical protein [Burkholderia sp. L27(2015)]
MTMPIKRRSAKLTALALALTFITSGFPVRAFADDPGWPRERDQDGAHLILYQPQIDEWKQFKQVTGRMAISLTPRGGTPQIGVVTLEMNTDTDMDSRTVLLSKPTITGTSFPGADPTAAKQLDQLMRTFLNPDATMTISVDRLVASVDQKANTPPVAVKNDPPAIFASFGPGILLFVDGAPVIAPVENTDMQVVINANWPLFLDSATHQYYLFTGQRWVSSNDLKSGWKEASSLPAKMAMIPGDPQWASLKPYMGATGTHAGKAPTVYFSDVPAELIVFGGKPTFSPIRGTKLTFATNTDSDLFVYTPTGAYYYLSAGRWFAAPGPTGPWTYATDQLPADFANIPHNSPASRVLTSVPGTPEAKDAVLLAQIPTTVEINPTAAAAAVKVSYSGDPAFVPITGTSMSYASNTPAKVIKVEQRYYLCSQGIWFDSAAPIGPWQTTVTVPKVIYTIPASSPVYNVVYVTQYATPTGTVQASYTAGYLGVFIAGAALGAIVAQGNGYYYPPYISTRYGPYPVYYPRPAPYGYHTYNPYTGASGTRGGVYGPNGSAQWGSSYNPYTGTYARGATVSGPNGSASVGQAYNPRTGAYGTTQQGSNAYGQWGSSVVTKGNQWAATQHTSNSKGTIASYQNSSGAKAVAGRGAMGSAAVGKTANGNMYAGKDGNVYKNTNGSWQKYDNGSWSTVNKPASTNSSTSNNKPQSAQQQRPATPTANAAQTRPATQTSQQQRAAATPGRNATQTKPSAQTYQQQRPTQQPASPQRNAASPARPGTSAGSYGQLNQDMQNRQRGATQSQRFAQGGGGGGGGGGGRAANLRR